MILTIACWLLGFVLAFYILAPLPSLAAELYRWGWACYQYWRHPPLCSFCNRKALGVFAHGLAPISFGVCEEHADQLGKLPPDMLPLVGDRR